MTGLKTGGRSITPIKRGKIEHVVELPKYASSETHYTFEGFYTYLPEAFDPSMCHELGLRIFSEDDPSKPETKIIERKRVQRIWDDFEEYRGYAGVGQGEPGKPEISSKGSPHRKAEAISQAEQSVVTDKPVTGSFADPEVHYQEGLSKAKKGYLDEAIAAFKRVLVINSNHINAHYNIAAAYYYKQEYILAWEHVHKLQRMGVTVPDQLLIPLRNAYPEPR